MCSPPWRSPRSALGPGALRARRDPVRARLRARAAPALARCDRGGRRVAADVVWWLLLRDTVERPYAEVERFSASASDSSPATRASSSAIPRLAAAAARRAGPRVACVSETQFPPDAASPSRSGLGALRPALLALGSNPGYGVIWRCLHATRVPERLLPIACLAALAAVAIACVSETQACNSSPRSPQSPSPPTCGCRSTAPSSPTRGTQSYAASPRRRRGGCSSCRRSRRTTTPAACTSTTRCGRQGAAARLCHLQRPGAIAPPGSCPSAHASWESVSSSRIETASRNRRGLLPER